MARRRRVRGFTRRQGRQGLWARYTSFTPSNVVTAPLYTEDALIFPALWERELQDVTQPKRGMGGALMKRAFGQVVWEITQDDQASTVVVPTFEILVFAASTQEPAATAAADFNTNAENQRVLHYSMKGPDTCLTSTVAAVQTRWYCTMSFDIKVSAKLPGQDIVLSTRCSETDTASVDTRPRANFTAYLTTP